MTRKYWARGGVLFERVSWSRIPLVVAAFTFVVAPALLLSAVPAFAKGPIVSATIDWGPVLWFFFRNLSH